MINIKLFILIILSLILLSSCADKPEKVLIFSKTVEFRHSSIETGVTSLTQFLESKNIQVDATENAIYFTEDSLKHYSAVIFLNTTGNVLNNIQQADFERYIQAGGGYIGIHAATDTEYNWPWYNKLVGAYFNGHPAIQEATVDIVKKNDPCCQHLPDDWSLDEEWYNFKSINPTIDVLMTLDESSYEGGTNGTDHPIVWKHHYDGGRAFYTAIGHQEATFSNQLYLQQVFAGIQFAIGDNTLDYSRSTTRRVPEENRFHKQVLDFNLDEPMELDELGDRGIIYIERRGAVKLYDYDTEQIKSLDTVDVHYNNEDGLLGLAVDPNYTENNWIYLFYSPDIEEPIQHVSRFTLQENKLKDEKILLKIPLIRKCCHSGGSLEFDKNGLLFIGVGDNTNPFESSGYAPIDEREGRRLYDAQRSASNTNDLRGKILRIRPQANGSYSIPKGNLFPEGTEKSRPEIYVMGCRNPFRFSIDTKTNDVYWGDVGPDAGVTDSLRGPAGMGEFNQATQAGYYGWPYSRGNNQMYFDYDFSISKPGQAFDPDNIINNSPNNSGLQNLPPIQESMIWFSYKKSKEFPWLGSGGVNPMSGPIYHADDYESTDHSFPQYFEGKWFIYEWMRDWIYVVELDKDKQFLQADPFMSSSEFSHPMDMLFAKDGKLYIIEYGQKWNSRNLDARLSVISYIKGNRAPIAQFEVDKEVGAAPLTVHFSAGESVDYDHDNVKYNWSFGSKNMTTDSPKIDYTFLEAGIYDVELTVSDPTGASASMNKKIMVGNDPPKINIELSDSNTTYWKNKKMKYKINVSDLEDGNTTDATIDLSKVKVTLNYIPEGEDIILASVGHQQNIVPAGLKLINDSGCKSCHAIKEKVAGPSYQDVAARYEKEDKQQIIRRIIKGSHGIWGEQMMAAHPQLNIEEVGTMVDYILSLDDDRQNKERKMDIEGSIIFDDHMQGAEGGQYILIASYLDQGNPNIKGSSLSAVEQIVFRTPKMEMENAFEIDSDMSIWNSNDRTVVGSITDGKQIKFTSVAFDKMSSITIGAVFNKNYNYEGEVEIRTESANGKLLGKGHIQFFDKNKSGFKKFDIKLGSHTAVEDLVLVFKNKSDDKQYIMNGDWVQLNYNE